MLYMNNQFYMFLETVELEVIDYNDSKHDVNSLTKKIGCCVFLIMPTNLFG